MCVVADRPPNHVQRRLLELRLPIFVDAVEVSRVETGEGIEEIHVPVILRRKVREHGGRVAAPYSELGEVSRHAVGQAMLDVQDERVESREIAAIAAPVARDPRLVQGAELRKLLQLIRSVGVVSDVHRSIGPSQAVDQLPAEPRAKSPRGRRASGRKRFLVSCRECMIGHPGPRRWHCQHSRTVRATSEQPCSSIVDCHIDRLRFVSKERETLVDAPPERGKHHRARRRKGGNPGEDSARRTKSSSRRERANDEVG
jgi:hypothetical protein